MGLFEDNVNEVIIESTLKTISTMTREQLEDLVIYLIKNYSVAHLILTKLKEYAGESVEVMLQLEEENPTSAEIIDELFETINARNEENNAKDNQNS